MLFHLTRLVITIASNPGLSAREAHELYHWCRQMWRSSSLTGFCGNLSLLRGDSHTWTCFLFPVMLWPDASHLFPCISRFNSLTGRVYPVRSWGDSAVRLVWDTFRQESHHLFLGWQLKFRESSHPHQVVNKPRSGRFYPTFWYFDTSNTPGDVRESINVSRCLEIKPPILDTFTPHARLTWSGGNTVLYTCIHGSLYCTFGVLYSACCMYYAALGNPWFSNNHL